MSLVLPPHKTPPFTSPIATRNSNTREENKITTNESKSSLKVFNKLLLGPKVRDAPLFIKFIQKEDEELEKRRNHQRRLTKKIFSKATKGQQRRR